MLMDKEIGQRLKELRISQGKSQAAMAELCLVSRPAWSQWEKGSKRITLEHAARLALKLGVSIDWITLGREPKEHV
ncbi:hypothetical protein LCGC14_2757680 [marine sediment metagenome]|uniref:HTH cro/C1-type domain-containing protein n=1 Tax=marine sediment metagenome TaxID=412755 RepID=A0A0F8ZLU3_9ZZZZ